MVIKILIFLILKKQLLRKWTVAIMNKLDKSLKQWVALGFIEPAQANRIQQYEASHTESSWFLSGLLILGAIIVSMGIISIIAANWQHIPDYIKLFADFVILTICGLLIIRANNLNKELQFEILLLFFIIFCLASIGLISQIYNTGGELYQALLLWSLITVALAVTAHFMVVPFIWLGGFIIGIVFTAMDSPLYKPLFHQNFLAIAMTVPFMCSIFLFFSNKFLASGSIRACQIWIFISGLVAISTAELYGASSELELKNRLIPFITGDILALFVLAGIVMDASYHQAQKSLLAMVLILFLLLCHLSILQIDAEYIYAIFTILILGLFAIFMASLKKRGIFQWLLFLIGIRFLILYFQALGGLARTGLGLIISGVLIIVLAILWNKYRVRLAQWAERLTQ